MHQRNKTRHLFCQTEVWTFLTVSLVGKECVVRPAILLSWRAAVTLPRLQQWTSGTWQPSQPAGDCPPGSQSDNCDLWTRWGGPVSLGCQWLRLAGPGDHGDYFYLLQGNPRQLQMEQPVQSSPECCVHHQIALYKALCLSSQHVQILCHSHKDHIVWRLSQECFWWQADGRCQIIGRKPNKEKGCLKINAEWCATYITDRHRRTIRVTRVTFPVCREVTRSMRLRTSWCIPGVSLVTARWISGRF